MSDVQKWNYHTLSYDDYLIPDDVSLILYTPDMEKVVACAGCFQPLVYGESFTSREIHNHIGLGYPVCDACYQKGWAESKQA